MLPYKTGCSFLLRFVSFSLFFTGRNLRMWLLFHCRPTLPTSYTPYILCRDILCFLQIGSYFLPFFLHVTFSFVPSLLRIARGRMRMLNRNLLNICHVRAPFEMGRLREYTASGVLLLIESLFLENRSSKRLHTRHVSS